MYFEVVTKTTPTEGLHYFARIRTDDENLFHSENYRDREQAARVCNLLSTNPPSPDIHYVNE
jgi:hypothetical protein